MWSMSVQAGRLGMSIHMTFISLRIWCDFTRRCVSEENAESRDMQPWGSYLK